MTSLRVLLVHNYYQQRGGEDAVVASEQALLEGAGHDVALYSRHNDELARCGKGAAAVQALWSRRTVHDIEVLVRQFRPQLIHAHNTFPLVSPSLYWVAARMRVPVVQTLHNFRLFCPQAMFLREGRVCEDCLGHVPWRGVVHRCYRGSILQSAVLAASLAGHRGLGTYSRRVTRYIALNEFCRTKFIEGGLPAERVVIKPNFVEVPAPPEAERLRSGGLFVGRLSPEKGIDVLARAVTGWEAPVVDVVGTGPLESMVREAAGLRGLGWRDMPGVYESMRGASFLVLPSIWYENFPRTLVEAFACGLPAIASRIGALAELVEDGVTGLLFEPGDAVDLRAKLRWAMDHPQDMARMGQAARARYDGHYTPEANYRLLMRIYREAMEAHT